MAKPTAIFLPNPKPIMSYEDWFLAQHRAIQSQDRATLVALNFVKRIGAVDEPRPQPKTKKR